MDTTAPNIFFDGEGICNYCKTHDALDKSFPINGNHTKIIKISNYSQNDCADIKLSQNSHCCTGKCFLTEASANCLRANCWLFSF